ncbi:uncharacterized protein K460DRAFT_364045 [Cucurbitaria berberidis CBS 394.84]|uniref:Single-strand DNA deaminase toxin A-like C-terminal domain-containing protein n=1 Tax=Cucurbitaria berberidis CBS 394.84 TaxID=1168544 RepID=A0A9P4LB60_9PLEO|nr:uncharacterized protein K460DRAFT_364045 [Cucurbitaria berberidis CBS 394.84]KAF1848047.1 hypothetical protein K460DRAFT_364045 [Cucurbitaria berberidis CBS 394.84]
MVDWLLKNGAELHAANLDGRTALMEASLWGRLDNVGVLLKGETNRRQRDREGNSALDLAMQSESNSRRRYLRSGKEGIIERPWKDDQDRRKIVELLSPDVATFVNESGSNLPLFDRSLGGERTNLVLKQFLTMRDPEQKRQKTVVRLVDGLLTIDAMSGWKHNDKYTIPGDVTEVLRFAEAIGFSFAPDKQSSMRFSDGSPVDERYYASHAEPQAIVQYLRLMDLGLDIDLAHQQQLSTKQSNLREVQLIVSNKICPKCAEFMARINSLAMSSAGFQLVAWERFMDENGKLVSTKQIWP